MAFVRTELSDEQLVPTCPMTVVAINLLEMIIDDPMQTNADRKLADELQVWCHTTAELYDRPDLMLARSEMRRMLALGNTLCGNTKMAGYYEECRVDLLAMLQ